MRLGQEFAAYGLAVEKGRKFLALASSTLRELGLGGSAVGTGINTHPDYRVKAIAHLARISGQQLTPAQDMRWATLASCKSQPARNRRGMPVIISISPEISLFVPIVAHVWS